MALYPFAACLELALKGLWPYLSTYWQRAFYDELLLVRCSRVAGDSNLIAASLNG